LAGFEIVSEKKSMEKNHPVKPASVEESRGAESADPLEWTFGFHAVHRTAGIGLDRDGMRGGAGVQRYTRT